MYMKKKQIEWINIIRGFAIVLIVLGHAIGYSKKLNNLTSTKEVVIWLKKKDFLLKLLII